MRPAIFNAPRRHAGDAKQRSETADVPGQLAAAKPGRSARRLRDDPHDRHEQIQQRK